MSKKFKNAAGKAKEAYGKATGDESKQAEGKGDQFKAKAEDTVDQAKAGAEDKASDLQDRSEKTMGATGKKAKDVFKR